MLLSIENKTLFDANPARFAPSYGGFCAYAVLNNFTADVNPAIWHIEGENLYLFAGDAPREAWLAEITNGAVDISNSNWDARQE